MNSGNFFSDIPEHIPEELFEVIIGGRNVRVERIVSDGQASPAGFWYDQEQSEWVMVLRGSAGLRFEGSSEIVDMKPGDYINIPARTKHRVEWTDANERTVWVAIFY